MDILNIEIDKKTFIKILVISIVLIIVYLALTMSSLLVFKSYKLGPNTTVNDEKINMHIDVLETNGGKKLEIAGWAYKEDEELKSINSNYVIRNQENGKMYLMKTKMEENINITEEKYKKAGLHAQCLLFGIPKGRYDIYVLYRNGENDILANTLIWVDI